MHLRFLAIEVYKSFMDINPEFIWDFFSKNPVQYNLRGDIVYLPHARSSCDGVNSLAFQGSLLWNNLPSDVEQINNLVESEAATRGVLLIKVSLEISQNSQKNTCARVSFLIKLQAWGLKKRDSGTGVFLWILPNF